MENAADQIRSRFPDIITEVSDESGRLKIDAIPSGLYDLCRYLRDELQYDYPADLCAADTGEQFVVRYQLYAVEARRSATLRVELPRDGASLPSAVEIWPGMNWHEREIFDLFGIRFPGHPEQDDPARMRILLPEDWDGHPFRKDYEPVFSGSPLHGPQETN